MMLLFRMFFLWCELLTRLKFNYIPTNILIVYINLNDCYMFDQMSLDRFQVIPILLINISYTCVINWHFQYEVLFANFIRGEYLNIFLENSVILGFQKFTCYLYLYLCLYLLSKFFLYLTFLFCVSSF